jgi:hypothetical protein
LRKLCLLTEFKIGIDLVTFYIIQGLFSNLKMICFEFHTKSLAMTSKFSDPIFICLKFEVKSCYLSFVSVIRVEIGVTVILI